MKRTNIMKILNQTKNIEKNKYEENPEPSKEYEENKYQENPLPNK